MENIVMGIMVIAQLIKKGWRAGPLGKLLIGCGGFFFLNCICSLPFVILGPVVAPQGASSTRVPAEELVATSAITQTSISPTYAAETATFQVPTSAGHVVIVAVDKRIGYVDIENQGDTPQDLTGWHLLSERGEQDCLLAGAIHPGQTLRIWAMAQDTEKGGYNCGFEDNIWDTSESDPAVLFDSEGREINRM